MYFKELCGGEVDREADRKIFREDASRDLFSASLGISIIVVRAINYNVFYHIECDTVKIILSPFINASRFVDYV